MVSSAHRLEAPVRWATPTAEPQLLAALAALAPPLLKVRGAKIGRRTRAFNPYLLEHKEVCIQI